MFLFAKSSYHRIFPDIIICETTDKILLMAILELFWTVKAKVSPKLEVISRLVPVLGNFSVKEGQEIV